MVQLYILCFRVHRYFVIFGVINNDDDGDNDDDYGDKSFVYLFL